LDEGIGFSQKNIYFWLKPIECLSIIRWLKPTAMNLGFYAIYHSPKSFDEIIMPRIFCNQSLAVLYLCRIELQKMNLKKSFLYLLN